MALFVLKTMYNVAVFCRISCVNCVFLFYKAGPERGAALYF